MKEIKEFNEFFRLYATKFIKCKLYACTFDANRPMILDVTHLDEIARIAQGARIQTLLIYAGQLDGAVAMCRTFHL